MSSQDAFAVPRSRAQPMAGDDRREMIAAAAVPLFVEYGASLTTKQLAEHLGIAEGTIFRAFGDKTALVKAVVDTFFAQTRTSLEKVLVDPQLSLESKTRLLVGNARSHARGVFAMLSLLDPADAHEYISRHKSDAFEKAVTDAFHADAERLRVPPERVGALIRLVVIAAAAPTVDGGAVLTPDELVDFTLYGIAGRPAADPFERTC